MPAITNIEDLRRIYRRRVPKMFYDYAESGSWTEQTFRENVSDFADIRLRQRIARDMDNRSTATTMLGEEVSKVRPTLLLDCRHDPFINELFPLSPAVVATFTICPSTR